MKRVRMIAAALAAASLCMGCSDGTNDDGIPGAPSVSLPESVGNNPFEGMTFFSGRDKKYVFSEDGRTVTYWYCDDDEFVPGTLYRCSVDAGKEELSWAFEKTEVYGKLLSYEECMRLCTDKDSYSAAARAWYEEQLESGRIDADEYKEELERVDEYLNNNWDAGMKWNRCLFEIIFSLRSRFTYTYNEKAETLDLEEQFEGSAPGFYFYDDDRTSIVDSAHICLSGCGWINLGADSTFVAKTFSASSSGEITFVNTEDESDTFTATYKLIDSGNDTQLNLQFTYYDGKFDELIPFSKEDLHLTEEMEGAE